MSLYNSLPIFQEGNFDKIFTHRKNIAEEKIVNAIIQLAEEALNHGIDT